MEHAINSPQINTPAQGDNFLFIDLLRGLAAPLVVYFHWHLHVINNYSTQSIEPGSFTYWFVLGFIDLGKYAVVMFFCISGFLIPASLRSYPNLQPKRFIIHRFFRLYPVYWLSISLFVIFHLSIFHLCIGVQSPLYLSQIMANLTMFHKFFGIDDVIGAFWTLQIELTFYILCVVLFMINRLERNFMMIALSLVGAFIFALVKAHLHRDMPEQTFLGLTVMFLGDAFRDHGRRITRAQLISYTILILVALIPICKIAYQEKSDRYLTSYYLAIFTFILGYAFLARFNLGRLWKKTIEFFANSSYGVYLFHGAFGLEMGSLALKASENIMISFFATFLSTYIMAYLSFKFIELPSIRLGKGLAHHVAS